MHDSRKAPLQVGDHVLLEGVVTEVSADSGWCNVTVRLVTPKQADPPQMPSPVLYALNTRMLTKVGE